MGRLKIAYDVINSMKEKEVVSGTFTAVGTKDHVEIGHFVNEFEKNLTNGETKVKISTEFDCDGKKLKHDSQSEFTMQGCSSHKHHSFMRHMHHHNTDVSGQNQEDHKTCGMKGRLAKLALMLNVLNQIKVEENEDESALLTLNLNELPEELKKVFQGKMSHHPKLENHPHHDFLKTLCTMSDPKIGLNIWINKAREVEKIVVKVDGNKIDGLNETHDLSLKAELLLT